MSRKTKANARRRSRVERWLLEQAYRGPQLPKEPRELDESLTAGR